MAIGQIYRINVENEQHSAANTLMQVQSPSDAVTIIERVSIGQRSVDTAEQLSGKIQRIATAGAGTAHTPTKTQEGFAAYGGTVTVNVTGSPLPDYTGGDLLYTESFNNLSGFLWTPASDDEVIVIKPSGILGVALTHAPIAATNFDYGATIREVGG